MVQKNSELRRARMIEAAMHLFSEKGFYSTGVEDIIRDAGVGKGTFYRNFKNKEEIFVAILIQFLTDWSQSVLVGVDQVKPATYLEYVKTMARESFQFFIKNYELSNLYSRIAPGLHENIEHDIKAFEDLVLGYLVEDLRKAQSMGYLDEKLNVHLAANIITGAFFRVIYYYFLLKKDESNAIDLDALIEDFVHMVFSGVLTK